LLERAVARAFGAERAGIFLSGGLDSISVAAVAADWSASHGRPRPLALSLAFPDPQCDERLGQTTVARRLGLPQHLVDFWDAVGSQGLLRSALALSGTLASPLLNTWGPAYQTLARGARTTGVDTIFTGMGGDEWLTVTPLIAADLMAQGRFVAVADHLRTVIRSNSLSRAQAVRNVLWSFGMRPLVGRALYRLAPQAWDASRARRRVADDPAWVAPDPALRATLRSRAPRHLGQADPPDGFYLQELRASLGESLVSWELEEQFQFGEQTGVEFAHPFWDADLVDALLRTPPALLSRGGRSKGLVRESVSRRFPGIGLDRQRKVSGRMFYRDILAREGAAALDSVGGLTTLDTLGVVNGRQAREAALRATGDPRQRAHVWELANLETWARAHAG
jgi:asparagine synthetase B (glutamine-hydrolysing)